mgnify:CR=1 FL=1
MFTPLETKSRPPLGWGTMVWPPLAKAIDRIFLTGFKRKRLVIITVVSVALVGTVIFVRQLYVLPILMYHSIPQSVASGNALTVSVNTFQKQMAFLKKNHINVLALDSLGAYLDGRNKIPGKAVVLTFDDGYKDNYTYAFPILKKYKFPATIFIIVSEVGRPDRLSWEEIREMQDSGLVTFGSHTLTHPYLESIQSAEELKREISGAKQVLQERLGKSVNAFSYPMGRFNPLVVQTVKDAGYTVAVVTNPGRRFPNQDKFILKRLRISQNAENMFVFWIESSGYYNLIREIRQRKK